MTAVDGAAVSSHYRPSAQVDNPSGRRQSLTIDFECEGCALAPRLSIAQHKGQTLLAWSCADPFGELKTFTPDVQPVVQYDPAAKPPPRPPYRLDLTKP